MGDPIFYNPLGEGTTVEILITKLLSALITLGIQLLVLYIVYAGFKFITAQGDSAQVTKARESLYWAMVGGAVLIGAKVIESILCGTITAIGGAGCSF